MADTAKPLTGRHAIVTGGGRGIGATIADKLDELGAQLTLIGRTAANVKKKSATLANTQAIAADVTDPNAVKQAINEAQATFGPVAILINNVGAASSAPFQRIDNATWHNMLDVNLNSVFYCTREILPGMLGSGWGRIINVASIAGVKGLAYIAAYCAAKHGVIGLTRALAVETAKTAITVNAICPGYTSSDMLDNSIKNIMEKTSLSRQEAEDKLKANNPQNRFIEPDEIATTVAWLCLPGSESITGQAIAIAGGEIM